MFKLIKYELIGKWRALAILSISIIILNLALLGLWSVWNHGVIIMLSVLISMVSSVVIFVWCITIFTNDIYDDKGYLTFTVPQRGYSILGAKLIMTIIFSLVVSVISGGFSYILISKAANIPQWLDKIGVTINVMPSIIFLIYSFVSSALKMLEIYFAITVTRLAVFKKKLGKFIAFLAVVVEFIILAFINLGLSKLFKQDIYIKVIKSVSGSVNSGNSTIDTLTRGIPLPIATDIVFPIILFIVLFIATGYMIENKIDL